MNYYEKLNEYIEYLQSLNYVQATIKGRKLRLLKFIDWLNENKFAGKNLNVEIIEKYKDYLIHKPNENFKSKKNIAVSTQIRRLIYIKQFCLFLVKTGVLLHNPVSLIKYPKVYYKIKWKLITDEQLAEKIKNYELNSPEDYRNLAIVKLLYSSGMRAAELVYVELADIDYETEFVRIRQAKGGKERVEPISADTVKTLKNYVENHRPALINHLSKNFLFVSGAGGILTNPALSRYIQKVIGKEYTAHCLRVACSTHMMKYGADIRFVQQQLGHTSLNSIEPYIRLEKSELKKIHTQTHPAEKRKNNE
ncbi:tyrosine-type recombinase/integrase [Candidatus Dependentiae bacterium]|nr:tyrosine-type recombinase/integrase [Candidatus Dependentiae bacterium]